MRWLIDAHAFDHDNSEGITTYLKGIYSQLPRLAPEIEFCFASESGEALSRFFGTLPNVSYAKLPSQGRTRRLMLDYPRLIRDLRTDYAHFQYLAPPLKNCRTIVTLHDILFTDFPKSFPLSYRLSRRVLFGHTARRADVLATVSEYSRLRIADRFRIAAEKITVTPNAISDDFLNSDRNAARQRIYIRGIRPYLLNVSRIEPRKNQLALVKAYADLSLADRGYDLVIIGRPDIGADGLLNYIHSLPPSVSSHIHLPGPMPHDELKDWYAAASLFVFPSLAEGFGIPPLEAAATRTPVICHNATALADFKFFGDNHADLSDPANLARLIDRNLKNPIPDPQLKSIADTICRTYSWRKSAQALLDSVKTQP